MKKFIFYVKSEDKEHSTTLKLDLENELDSHYISLMAQMGYIPLQITEQYGEVSTYLYRPTGII